MAGGISRDVCIALILRYIGGTPIRGSVNVFSNKLLVARKVGFGGLGGLTDQVLASGLGSVFQNPLGAVQSVLKGNITGAIGALKEHFKQPPPDDGGGGDPPAFDEEEPEDEYPAEIQALLDALGESGTGLFGSVESLTAATNRLSGVSLPGDLEFGLSDLLGLALDGSDTLFERASAPLNQLPVITAAETFVRVLAQKVIDTEMTPEAALETVEEYTSALDSALSRSAAAFAAMRSGAEALALVQEAAVTLMDAALVDGEVSRARSLVETIVRPAPLATMQDAVHAWTHPPDDETD